MKKILLILFTFLLFASGCMGIHWIPLTDDESIELHFDGPVTLSYRLQDGSEQNVVVEQELELRVRNRYDDGDPADTSMHEKFYSYFRIDAEGGAIHLGMDPAALHLITGDPLFPDPAVIAEYAATAQFELNGLASLVDPGTPVRISGVFTEAIAHRREFTCVDPNGSTLFVYDPQVFRLCINPNHAEILESRKDYSYDRATIVALTENDQHAMLVTQNRDDAVAEPPLVLKIVNTSYQAPVQDGTGSGGESSGTNGTEPAAGATGGCSLAANSAGMSWTFAYFTGFLFVGLYRCRRIRA